MTTENRQEETPQSEVETEDGSVEKKKILTEDDRHRRLPHYMLLFGFWILLFCIAIFLIANMHWPEENYDTSLEEWKDRVTDIEERDELWRAYEYQKLDGDKPVDIDPMISFLTSLDHDDITPEEKIAAIDNILAMLPQKLEEDDLDKNEIVNLVKDWREVWENRKLEFKAYQEGGLEAVITDDAPIRPDSDEERFGFMIDISSSIIMSWVLGYYVLIFLLLCILTRQRRKGEYRVRSLIPSRKVMGSHAFIVMMIVHGPVIVFYCFLLGLLEICQYAIRSDSSWIRRSKSEKKRPWSEEIIKAKRARDVLIHAQKTGGATQEEVDQATETVETLEHKALTDAIYLEESQVDPEQKLLDAARLDIKNLDLLIHSHNTSL